MCHVMMGNLVMFRKDSVLNILSKERTLCHCVNIAHSGWTVAEPPCAPCLNSSVSGLGDL